MADIALVSLALDATGVVAGEKQATRSLEAVHSAMQQTEKQGEKLNTSLNANLKRTGDAFKGVSQSASSAGAALSSLGGPVGRVAGEVTNLVGQVQSMTGAFGVAASAYIAAAAGVAALSAAFVKLTIDGSAVSDQMLDIAETTGLGIDTVQRLSAAMNIAGESPDALIAAFKSYQSAVVEAQDKTSQAARVFKVLGLDARAAGEDIVGSFTKSVTQIKAMRETVAGAEATNILYGKQAGALARSQDAVTLAMTGTREELEDKLLIATKNAITAGGELDAQINTTSNTWSVFKQNLADTQFGGSIKKAFEQIDEALRTVLNTIKEIEKQKGSFLLGLGTGGIRDPFQGEVNRSPVTGPKRSLGVKEEVEKKITAGDLAGLVGGGTPKAPKSAKSNIAALAPFTFDQALQALGKGMKEAEERAEGLANGVAAMNARFLEILGGRVGNIMRGTPLAQPGGLIQTGGPGQPFPGAPIFGGLPPPETIRTEEQARLDEQFSAIFDDMLVSILTARKTVGEAFAGLALGIVDTFAIEFAKAMREAFITPLIKGLTDHLISGLKSILASIQGSLRGGGGGGFWAGLLQAVLGGAAGGAAGGAGSVKFGASAASLIRVRPGFAEGGVIGAGQWGLVGERGPEYIRAGAHPATIIPMTGGGNTFNINFAITTPNGQVDKRTQDQMAAQVYNAVKRAQRNEGSR